MATTPPPYKILMSKTTWEGNFVPYVHYLMPIIQRLVRGEDIGNTDGTPGIYLQRRIASDFARLKAQGLSDEYAMFWCLINTKSPQIFAESQVWGHGMTDWNPRELDNLGDIAIAVPVTIFDNGRHQPGPADVHDKPFHGTLLYVAGLLFRNGNGQKPCDYDKAVSVDSNGEAKIDAARFYQAYERRLLPSLLYANHECEKSNKKGFITIPGLGCGMFAGPFEGQLGILLQATLYQLLDQHHDKLPRIKAVYFDPYRECKNAQYDIGHIKYLVRPLAKNKNMKPQLCHPSVFQEHHGDDFANCHLFSFVAWDHVSWPGNDYWIGDRKTDDGVKAAATSSMSTMTGIQGSYDTATRQYMPPPQFNDWQEVVEHYNLEIQVTEKNFHIVQT